MYISIIILHDKEKNKKGNNIVFYKKFRKWLINSSIELKTVP